MFFTGAITLFRGELEIWQEPLAQQAAVTGTHQALLERALGKLPVEPEGVWFYPKESGAAELGYTDPKTGVWQRFWFDGHTGALIPRRERLADFLYNLHFLWHEVTGDWLYYASGFFAVGLLLAIATGVLIHLKDIVRQFHQFRPDKSRRVLWSDMHKVLGVMGLPFQLLYAYTGALIVLAPLLLGALIGPVFGGDEQRAASVFWGMPARRAEQAGVSAPVLSLDELAARARAVEPRLAPETYRVHRPGRANGSVDVYGSMRGTTPKAHGAVRLRLTDGQVLHVDSPATESALGATWRWVRGLHYAYFGGVGLRVLFFVLALATSATILTGNWVWLARRQARSESPGNLLLEGLTVGIGVGTLVATAALFLASRLLPFELRDRGATEEIIFMGVFVFCAVWACMLEDRRSLWWQGVALAGLLLLPVPLLASRWSEAGLFGSGQRIGAVVGVDIALLAMALALCGISLALRRGARQSAKVRRARGAAVHAAPRRAVALLPVGGRDA